MGVCAHAANARGCKRFQFGYELSSLVKQFLGLLRAHPILENLQTLGIFLHVRHWNLVSAPEAFELVATDLSRCAPALRTTEDNHRPAWSRGDARGSGFFLGRSDVTDALLSRC